VNKIEFVKSKSTKEPFPPSAKLSFHIQETGLKPEYSISLYGAPGCVDGVRGDHVILAPPYNVSRDQIDEIVERTVRVIEAVFAEVVVGDGA
jgi:adenosylmethionine-8-amino-7-oxononanoate aminotransferase